MPDPDHVHLAVALDGAGWHPAAWREPEARPTELLSGRYRVELDGWIGAARRQVAATAGLGA